MGSVVLNGFQLALSGYIEVSESKDLSSCSVFILFLAVG